LYCLFLICTQKKISQENPKNKMKQILFVETMQFFERLLLQDFSIFALALIYIFETNVYIHF